MTPDPVVTREAAHVARRDSRAVLAAEEWPFRDLRAELAAAAMADPNGPIEHRRGDSDA